MTYLARDEVTSREIASGFPVLRTTLSSSDVELICPRRQICGEEARTSARRRNLALSAPETSALLGSSDLEQLCSILPLYFQI